jgi:class 3 adenylate cyclase
MNVAEWLRHLGCGQYESAFLRNDVLADLLPSLTAQDLGELGVNSVGHCRRMLDAIAQLRARPSAQTNLTTGLSPLRRIEQPAEQEAERRQLSVMFCDLVGSTALSSRIDAEDLRELLRSYQAHVRTAVEHCGGYVSRYVGDGVLVYFGWPEAHETDAERAVLPHGYNPSLLLAVWSSTPRRDGRSAACSTAANSGR